MTNDKNVTPWDLCIKHIISFLFFYDDYSTRYTKCTTNCKGQKYFFTKKYDAPKFV